MSSIPTENAAEALEFCRALSSTLLRARPREEVDLSVVIPVFNEEQNVTLIHERLSDTLRKAGVSYEIIFVDDGSTGPTKEILAGRAKLDARVSVIELTRNFGQQAAFSAGLTLAAGRAVVIMDCDLQDSPETIATFLERWREGFEIVYAVRTEREEHGIKRMAYYLFYRFYRFIAGIEVPVDAGDFCLLDRRVVDILLSLEERNRFLRGLRSWVGLKQLGIPVKREARASGESKYDFARLINLALDGLVSFSFAPLRVISVLGITVSILSAVLAIVYGIKKALYGLNPPGFATIVVLLCFFAGIQLLTIGVIGEYIGKIFVEVKRRPQYLVSKIIGAHETDSDAQQ